MFRRMLTSLYAIVIACTACGVNVDAGAPHRAKTADRQVDKPSKTELGLEASLIRSTIGVFDQMTDAERSVLIPWLWTMVMRQSDQQIERELSAALEAAVARLNSRFSENGPPVEPEMVEIGLVGEERANFERVLRESTAPIPPESELKDQIEALTLDPKNPGAALNAAAKLGSTIERIPDEGMRTRMMKFLENKVMAIQGL